jgi:hypothetical protein
MAHITGGDVGKGSHRSVGASAITLPVVVSTTVSALTHESEQARSVWTYAARRPRRVSRCVAGVPS